jgi:sec-independent protein translocase protein TatA
LFLPRPEPSFGANKTLSAGTAGGAEDVAMGSLSIVHWIIIIAVALLLFGGRGKISSLMGDFAEGIKAFKKGMSEDDKAEASVAPSDPKTIDHKPGEAVSPQPESRKAS